MKSTGTVVGGSLKEKYTAKNISLLFSPKNDFIKSTVKIKLYILIYILDWN